MEWWILVVVIVVAIILTASMYAVLTSCAASDKAWAMNDFTWDIFKPRWVYKNYKVTKFGAILYVIFLITAMPMLAIMAYAWFAIKPLIFRE